MKVFLSWSGELSRQIACAFREWLPSVIQAVVPYVSSEDIDKGTRWSSDIATELAESSFGILCVTQENLVAPWIHFEAGALSKSLEKANVTPFLYGVKRSEVKGPLLQFQSTIFEKDDIHKLLKSLNQRLKEGERLKDEALRKSLDVWWPQLETAFKNLDPTASDAPKPVKHAGAGSDILEEMLELLRSQQRLLSSPELLLPRDYLACALPSSESNILKEVELAKRLDSLRRALIRLKYLAAKTATKHRDWPKLKDALAQLDEIFRSVSELSSLKVRYRVAPRTEIDEDDPSRVPQSDLQT